MRYLAPSTSSSLVGVQLPSECNTLNTVLFRLAHCVADAIQMVPYVMGDLFVRWHLDERELQGAREIVARVRSATRDGFLRLAWVDEQTRREALRRIDNLGSLIGHPDNVSRWGTNGRRCIHINAWHPVPCPGSVFSPVYIIVGGAPSHLLNVAGAGS